MAILKVARMGHPLLRRTADPIPAGAIGSTELEGLLKDMLLTMREYAGIGLAAPQVHVPSRAIVVSHPWTEDSDEEDAPAILLNPEIVAHSEEEEYGWEGCLSIPDIRGEVPRWGEIRVRATSPAGEPMDFVADGFPARVIQHEVDHLNGILFLDRMESLERLAFIEEYVRYLRDDDTEDHA